MARGLTFPSKCQGMVHVAVLWAPGSLSHLVGGRVAFSLGQNVLQCRNPCSGACCAGCHCRLSGQLPCPRHQTERLSVLAHQFLLIKHFLFWFLLLLFLCLVIHVLIYFPILKFALQQSQGVFGALYCCGPTAHSYHHTCVKGF